VQVSWYVVAKTLVGKKQLSTQVIWPYYPIWVIYRQVGNQWSRLLERRHLNVRTELNWTRYMCHDNGQWVDFHIFFLYLGDSALDPDLIPFTLKSCSPYVWLFQLTGNPHPPKLRKPHAVCELIFSHVFIVGWNVKLSIESRFSKTPACASVKYSSHYCVSSYMRRPNRHKRVTQLACIGCNNSATLISYRCNWNVR